MPSRPEHKAHARNRIVDDALVRDIDTGIYLKSGPHLPINHNGPRLPMG
jgi:hypothetical protein